MLSNGRVMLYDLDVLNFLYPSPMFIVEVYAFVDV